MEETKKNVSDFTQGTVLSNLVRMAIPMTLALVVNLLYSVVDRIYLGHIPGEGANALTAIGLVFPVITVITAFQNLFGQGGTPLFSMARGRGDEKEAGEILKNSTFMLVVTALVLMAVGLIFKTPILKAVGTSEATFEDADQYLSIYLLGTVFVMISLGLNPYVNAMGFATIGMFTVVIGAVINIVLDPVFIFVLGLGIRGAAIATIIAQFCSALWVFLFIRSKRVPIRLLFRGFRPSFKKICKIMSLGVTEFCFQLTNSIVGVIFNTQLGLLGGDVWIAVMTVINSLREMTITLLHGVTAAAKPIMSYCYGAKRNDRVKETARWMLLVCGAWLLIMWILLMAAPQLFLKIFTSDTQVVENGRIGIRLYFCMIVFMALQMTGQGVFTALGKAKQALFFSLLRKVILVVPLAFILPHLFGLGVYGIFLAEPVSDVLGGLAAFLTMYFTVYRKI